MFVGLVYDFYFGKPDGLCILVILSQKKSLNSFARSKLELVGGKGRSLTLPSNLLTIL